MFTRHTVLILLALLLCRPATAQKLKWGSPEENAEKPASNMDLSKFRINDLKARGIIVRLPTNKDRINAYRKAGNEKVAAKMEANAKATALLLMYAFITEWTYSPVYFMESQHTDKLLRQDTLIAKTFDLSQDTSICISRDSFYLVDYGELLENDYDDKHPLKGASGTGTTNSPLAGTFLVVKDHALQQLQPPMPCAWKVWFDELTSTDKIAPFEIPAAMNDSMINLLSRFNSISSIRRSDSKVPAEHYLDTFFRHIYVDTKTAVADQAGLDASAFARSASATAKIRGNPYQISAGHLNKSFIEYYCKRLDKDKNIVCNDELYYWWMRNPNIRYLPYLARLEWQLKNLSSPDTVHTKK